MDSEKENIKTQICEALLEYNSLSWLAIYSRLYSKDLRVPTDQLYGLMKELIEAGKVETTTHGNTKFYNLTDAGLSDVKPNQQK
jgi:DNA-binding PadR family transcriptional regulator